MKCAVLNRMIRKVLTEVSSCAANLPGGKCSEKRFEQEGVRLAQGWVRRPRSPEQTKEKSNRNWGQGGNDTRSPWPDPSVRPCCCSTPVALKRSPHPAAAFPGMALEMLSITSYQRNANQCYNEISPHTSQNGYHQTSLQIMNATEVVEKKEPSYTVGRNVNWCSHYGESYGVSLKN